MLKRLPDKLTRSWLWPGALILLGAVITHVLHDVAAAAWRGFFENPYPSQFARLYWLWGLLAALTPGVLIGALVIPRRAAIISAAAYFLGALSGIPHIYEGEVPQRIFPHREFVPGLTKTLLEVALFGAVLAGVVSFLLRRARSTQRRIVGYLLTAFAFVLVGYGTVLLVFAGHDVYHVCFGGAQTGTALFQRRTDLPVPTPFAWMLVGFLDILIGAGVIGYTAAWRKPSPAGQPRQDTL